MFGHAVSAERETRNMSGVCGPFVLDRARDLILAHFEKGLCMLCLLQLNLINSGFGWPRFATVLGTDVIACELTLLAETKRGKFDITVNVFVFKVEREYF